MVGKTLYDKLWDAHLVKERADGTALIYIDRHFLHEVTSPQAFEGLRIADRKPWRINANLATVDHNVPTTNRALGTDGIKDPVSKLQITTLDENCDDFGILQYKYQDKQQGIIHIIGPELGATLPGMTIVCGDSHTSTHGAFGCLAHGIGTSEVEHVLATQCLIQKKMKNMLIKVDGKLSSGITPKDVILTIIGKIGMAGGTGYAIEFAGEVIKNMSMEGRMTVCNMAIEAGARSGLVAVDDTTINYIKGRQFAPNASNWDAAVKSWRLLTSDDDAVFDNTLLLRGEDIKPQVTWGTSPDLVVAIDELVPDPKAQPDPVTKEGYIRALEYMGLKANMPMTDIKLDRIFIGSCTNARIDDLRQAAAVVKGHKIATSIKQALVVPGSVPIKLQAEKEGLDKIFLDAGFEWREPGCSMCLAMNPDKLGSGEHCAATSNRNFEGRQGAGGRTHLVSPSMAAAASIAGHFVDVSKFKRNN